MHSKTIVVLALSQMALAQGQYSNNTTPNPPTDGTDVTLPVDTTDINVPEWEKVLTPDEKKKLAEFKASGPKAPYQLGDYQYYGCTKSGDGFPTFDLQVSTPEMSLDFCAASCSTRFFGVYNTDCYCGDDLSKYTSEVVPDWECSIPCNGNKLEACGGLKGSKLIRRGVPLSAFLTVYIRTKDAYAKYTSTASPVTYTTTDSKGKPTEIVKLKEIKEDLKDKDGKDKDEKKKIDEWKKKKIVCYGDYCAPEFPVEDGKHERIVCEDDWCRPEPCETEDWSKLVVCKSGKCKYQECKDDECHAKKIVCYDGKCESEKCFGDECKKKLTCKDKKCEHKTCDKDCFKHEVCEEDKCKPVPKCNGECPVPPAPKPIAKPEVVDKKPEVVVEKKPEVVVEKKPEVVVEKKPEVAEKKPEVAVAPQTPGQKYPEQPSTGGASSPATGGSVSPPPPVTGGQSSPAGRPAGNNTVTVNASGKTTPVFGLVSVIGALAGLAYLL